MKVRRVPAQMRLHLPAWEMAKARDATQLDFVHPLDCDESMRPAVLADRATAVPSFHPIHHQPSCPRPLTHRRLRRLCGRS